MSRTIRAILPRAQDEDFRPRYGKRTRTRTAQKSALRNEVWA
jgi:hypothetical protein